MTASVITTAGVILPRAADAAAIGEATEAALINGGDDSPSGQAPMYSSVPAGQFAWDSEVEERFARFVSVRISVRSFLRWSSLSSCGPVG